MLLLMGDYMTSLKELLKRGGVFYDVAGENPASAIKSIIDTVHLPPCIDKATLLQAVLEREELMPTAHGFGIALPHPRTPVINNDDVQFSAIAVLQKPIEWRSLDGIPVFAACLIVSSSAKEHLSTLSRLNFFCCDADFRTLLVGRAGESELLSYIEKIESSWK
jgi:PTS system nitrogen regulatory IIA component